MSDYLAPTTLLRLLAVLGIVVVPHFLHMPWWFCAAFAAIVAWRVLATQRQWRLPPKSIRAALTFVAFASVYATFGQISGQTAGVTLLVVMAALKLTELRSKRDVIFLVFLMYFMLITHFLFSQEIWTILYLLACALLITAILIEVNHAGRVLPLKLTLRLGGVLIAQSLPLMLVLFVLFPRLPGPLWGIPEDSGAARSGLSDTMSPGDISRLIESDAVAFRVRFLSAPPPMPQRYWRGPVLEQFDGRKWTAAPASANPRLPAAQLDGEPVRYEVVIEPTNQPWLFALDLPDATTLPEESHLDPGYLLFAKDLVRERQLYTLTSYPHYRLQPVLGARERQRTLKLPPFGNPRTRELAQSWRSQGLDDEDLVKRALRMFHDENYSYTLQPPALGRDPVDEFLFQTRRGFCEHYASSFAALMRAAGIPARVVTGYQGGTQNAVGDYFIVRQSDAHAWTEVWLEGRGWMRMDPTAAVAPERVESGIETALHGAANLPAFLDPAQRSRYRFALQARWDWVNAQWNRWVLAYGPELQHELLSRFGLDDWRDLMLALTAAVSVILAGFGMLLMRQTLPVTSIDPALKAWHRMLRRLARQGLQPQPAEGPRDFAARVAAVRPDLAATVGRVAAIYLQLRYIQPPDAATQRALDQAVANLH